MGLPCHGDTRPRLADTPTFFSSHEDTLVQNGCLPVLLLKPLSCGAAGFLALNYLLACPRPAAEAAGAAVTVRRLGGVTSLRGERQAITVLIALPVRQVDVKREHTREGALLPTQRATLRRGS